jgi:hypothetical protein
MSDDDFLYSLFSKNAVDVEKIIAAIAKFK